MYQSPVNPGLAAVLSGIGISFKDAIALRESRKSGNIEDVCNRKH